MVFSQGLHKSFGPLLSESDCAFEDTLRGFCIIIHVRVFRLFQDTLYLRLSLTTSNKKLLVTSALLVVTRSY